MNAVTVVNNQLEDEKRDKHVYNMLYLKTERYIKRIEKTKVESRRVKERQTVPQTCLYTIIPKISIYRVVTSKCYANEQPLSKRRYIR